MVQNFTFSIADDRFVTPATEYATVRDLAKAVAGGGFGLSPHHKAIAVIQDGAELYRIDRKGRVDPGTAHSPAT